MKNPNWDRTANIAKSDLDMLQQELEEEFNNGKENTRSQAGRESNGAVPQAGSVNGGNPITQRNPEPDTGTNY